MKINIRYLISFILVIFIPVTLAAHHYKGLPHYSYFEHYPQVPVDEFLGQAGQYEMSLVIYDFQGMDNKEELGRPDDARLFLIIFNLQNNNVYNRAITLEILDNGKVLYTAEIEKAAEENVYRLNRSLPAAGDYALRVTLKEENNLSSVIPFKMSGQKTGWGKWIALALVILVVVAAYGSRKKRIMMDRKENIVTGRN